VRSKADEMPSWVEREEELSVICIKVVFKKKVKVRVLRGLVYT